MAATAIKSHILDNFREMVASCATFQDVVGAATMAIAKTRVYEFGATGDDVLPRAIVDHIGFTSRIVGTNCRNRNGELLASFELLIPDDQDETIQSQSQWFENQTGDICEELMDLARTTRVAPNNSETYMDLREYTMHESSGQLAPEEVEPDETGTGRTRVHWGVSYVFRWQG